MSTYDVLAWVWEIVHPRRVRVCADVIHGSRRVDGVCRPPCLRVTADRVFITNGDDFHSPTEESTRRPSAVWACRRRRRGRPRPRRVSVFFESLWARKTAWATNLPFDGVVPLS